MPQKSDVPIIICFAGDIWNGNPHSRHHLMRRFAGDFEVLFIEGIPMRSVATGDRHELRRIWSKLRQGAQLRTVAPCLHVLRPPPIPPAGRAGRAAQLSALRAHIGYARRRLSLAGPAVSWFSVPVAAPLRGRLREAGSLFYYQDRYDQFSHVDGPRLRSLTERLARECEVTVATSNDLAEDLRGMGADPLLAPHGVDLARFARDAPPPADLAGLEPPLIGHVGLLDDYLSLETLSAIADRLERGTLILLGANNTDVSRLERHPRVVRLGFRPYDAIPAYLSSFACCVAPFKINALTTAVNPIKLREYLAAGRPVVASPLPAIIPYSDVVELAEEPTAFADAVTRALDPDNDTPEARDRRRRRVAGESWDTVADQIRPLLLDLASSAGGSRRA